MARKRRESKRRKAKSRESLPDWRVLEGRMNGDMLGPGSGGNDSPLARAQELMYQAFEVKRDEQVQLAQEALALCPDCADAYVVLAEHASTLNEAIVLYDQGVAAGERAIGRKAFQRYTGRFWGFLETRPYMRARHALASCLRQAGRREEAVGHYREMLRLNPNDNQGVRYVLVACLLELGLDDDVERLLGDYEDHHSAEWAYARVLLDFRRDGDTQQVRRLLADAQRINEHVPAYLLGDKLLPSQPPDYIVPGGEDEAASYAAGCLSGWRATPGAISWLRRAVKAPLPRKSGG